MISTNDIKQLREKTGAGVLDCRDALTRCEGDADKALELLRQKGAALLEKRAEREAAHGYVAVYTHAGAVGSMVELRCETDFVSANQAFRDLAHELALQVAATSPQYISRADVPQTEVTRRAEAGRAAVASMEKPEPIVHKIVEGRLAKFYSATCLLEQASIRDETRTVQGLIQEKALAFGERIHVERFARFAID